MFAKLLFLSPNVCWTFVFLINNYAIWIGVFGTIFGVSIDFMLISDLHFVSYSQRPYIVVLTEIFLFTSLRHFLIFQALFANAYLHIVHSYQLMFFR